jgi:four helix bundle protein
MPLFKSIEDIDVWKESVSVVEQIYLSTSNHAKLRSDFGLRDQMQRSSVSIPSNIAEGFERRAIRNLSDFFISPRVQQENYVLSFS